MRTLGIITIAGLQIFLFEHESLCHNFLCRCDESVTHGAVFCFYLQHFCLSNRDNRI